MPTKLIALPCSASGLEAALHKVCDHGGHWSNRIHVCLYKPENRYALELHDEAFDGQGSTQDGAALGRGDAAALREALELVLRFLQWMYAQEGENAVTSKVQIADKIDRVISALSAPSRNCDLPLIAGGDFGSDADKAWRAFRETHPDAYFDVPGLMRCIGWLLEAATDKKGGEGGE